MHQDVSERIRIIRHLDFTRTPRIDAIHREHAAIADRISAGDTDAARRMLLEHTAESRDEAGRIALFMQYDAHSRRSAPDIK